MIFNKHKTYTYFKNRFKLSKKSKTGFHRMECPFCVSSTGSSSKAGTVNFDWERYICWRCGFNDYITQFVMDYEEIPYLQAKRLILQQETSAIDLDVFEDIPTQHETSSIELPAGYRSILEGDTILGERARRYLAGRGFDLDYLDSLGFGYCREKHPVADENYYGYIIVPFKRRGVLRYFIGRDYIGNYLRYKNPLADRFDISKSDLIFNEDALELSSVNYITEGWADALTMNKGGISSQGWSLSKDQKAALHSSNAGRFVFLPDVGFYKEAVKVAREFMDKREVQVVDFEAAGYTIETKKKDVNEIGRKAVMKLINRTPILTEGLAMQILTDD